MAERLPRAHFLCTFDGRSPTEPSRFARLMLMSASIRRQLQEPILFSKADQSICDKESKARAVAVKYNKTPFMTGDTSPGTPSVIKSRRGNCTDGCPRIDATKHVRRCENSFIWHDVRVALEQEISSAKCRRHWSCR
jgi:hypothetical protein